MTQQELYDELVKVRNAVKRKCTSGGRTPAVCSDDALKLIAAAAPKRGEDLQCIPGLGRTFVEKYGADFMAPIERYHKENASNAKITDDVRKIPDRMLNMAGSAREAQRFENDIYNFLDVGILISRKERKEPGRIGTVRRFIDQICFFSREGGKNRIDLVANDGVLFEEKLEEMGWKKER